MHISNNRNAFTMIELIFVIVIIGILASIAIPRLAATRMDAKLSTKAQNIMTAATEIAAYAVSQGQTEANLSDMSNSLKNMIQQHEAVDIGNYRADIKVEDSSDCIILRIDNNGTETETLVIAHGNTNEYCDRLRTLVDSDAFPLPLRGTIVEY